MKLLTPYRCVLVFFILSTSVAYAARRLSARQQLAKRRAVIPGLTKKRSLRDTRTDGIRNTRDVFGLKDESFRTTSTASTAQGGRQYKLTESYKGKDVFGASITLTTDSEGERIYDATGEYVKDIVDDIGESDVMFSDEELFEQLIIRSGDKDKIADIKGRRITHDIYTDSDDVAHMVAIVEYLIETDSVQKRPKALIKTCTGEIIYYYDNLETCFSREDMDIYGGNKKIGKIEYDTSNRCLDIREEGDICYLENKHVKVIDMNHSAIETSTTSASFNCSDSYHDSINGAYSPATDALYYGTQIVKMFKEWYQTEPVRGGLTLRVHFSRNVMNAYWNGYNITFGDGRRRVVYPLVCLDVAAHEIAHGFTEQHSGLLYFGQPGGLNEAFSDMAGEMAELYTNTTDWQVGADIMYRRPMRFFDDPERDGRSISHISKFSNTLSPHTTSGIYNKVFYLLAHEYGLDPVEVFRVFLHANKMYWQPLTDLVTGACDVMQAAYDVGQPGEPFSRAFSEVGIDVCDVEDHLYHLRPHVTISSIIVSNNTKPVFGLDLPEWSKDIVVHADTQDGDIVIIEVFSEMWAQINDTTDALVVGNNDVTYSVPHAGKLYHIRLSTDGSPLMDVRLTAEYTCRDNYTTSNNFYRQYYQTDCEDTDNQSTM